VTGLKNHHKLAGSARPTFYWHKPEKIYALAKQTLIYQLTYVINKRQEKLNLSYFHEYY
jgi:hypothetical protein